jgi:hypothetical protein
MESSDKKEVIKIGLPSYGKFVLRRKFIEKNNQLFLYTLRREVSDETRRLRRIYIRNLILQLLKEQQS